MNPVAPLIGLFVLPEGPRYHCSENGEPQVADTASVAVWPEAMVVSNDVGLTLSRKLARGAATLRKLEDAFRAGLPVEGRIERVVKGGYEVRIGGQRAFCPISQVDTVRTAAPEARLIPYPRIELPNENGA